jgi:hypothetical protein
VTNVEVPRSVAVWTPDVTWFERPEKDFTWRSQARLTLNSDGELALVGQAILYHVCSDMEFTTFPFDAHKCRITFVSMAHDGGDVRLTATLMTSQDFENDTHRKFFLRKPTSQRSAFL